MERALERHQAGEARVIPVIIHQADWTQAKFAKLQALPKEGKAVMLWEDRDSAWTDLPEGIRRWPRRSVQSVPAREREHGSRPQHMADLRGSWQRAWKGIGAQTQGADTLTDLFARYSEPHRKYHSLRHLAECIDCFGSVRGLAVHPAELEVGLWFHDAVYELRRHDNEEQSAKRAQAALLAAGVPEESVTRVEQLVLATQHSALPDSPDQQLLVDIDLSILGAAEPRFAEYERQIREEYSFVPELLFRHKRRAILHTFLDRPRIYSTAHFYSALEERARANLRRAVARSAG